VGGGPPDTYLVVTDWVGKGTSIEGMPELFFLSKEHCQIYKVTKFFCYQIYLFI
jgi:hypothetical protein